MLRGNYAKISTETKQRILDAANSGEDFVILAMILNVNRSTAYNIVKRGRPNNLPKGNGNAKKIDDEIIEYAVTELEKNCLLTLKELNSKIREHFPLKRPFTDQTLSRVLDGQCRAKHSRNSRGASRICEMVNESKYHNDEENLHRRVRMQYPYPKKPRSSKNWRASVPSSIRTERSQHHRVCRR